MTRLTRFRLLRVVRRTAVWLVFVAAAAVLAPVARAQDRIIDDIRISRSGEITTVEIELACAMRFQSDISLQDATLVEVRLAPFDDCRLFAAGGSEIRRPLNGTMAGLLEVEYEPIGLRDGLMTLRFREGVAYAVGQPADLRTIVITIDPALGPRPAGQVRQAQPEESAASRSEGPAQTSTTRRPLSPRIVTPDETADYMINLQSTNAAVDPSVIAGIAAPPGRRFYVSRTQADGQTWFRLRLGFFESEQHAREVLAPLQSRFPRAWIGRAEPDEIASAQESIVEASPSAPLPLIAADAEGAGQTERTSLRELPAEEVNAQMAQARAAMLDQDYETAIGIYSDMQQVSGDRRAEAAEFLGLAYERAGQRGQARAQYEFYLQQFSTNINTARVRQRLNGLILAAAQPAPSLRSVDAQSRWDSGFGISQYYRRNANQFDEDQEEITTLSALITDVDYSVSRRGDRLDLSSRVSLTHFHDMLSDTDRRGQKRISHAFFEIESNISDWWLRLGRQTLHSFGVLGRFDGARFDYTWAPEKIVHVVTGYPVESTRDSVETDRQFYGAAVEFQNVIGNWDFSAFVNQQTIESIDARQAVGTEIRYSDTKRTFTSILDYDTDFSELNTLLMLGTWRLQNGLTLSALVDERKSPILTTRNALIGQPVTTVDELLLVWSEDEVRQLAVDRTAESSTLTLGVAAPLGQRYQINFDYTSTEVTGTLSSGGVAATDSTGTQSFYSTSIVGNGLFGGNDVSILNIRYGSSDRFETTTLTWDSRFPIGRRVRLNPRIRFNTWEDLQNGRKRDAISPTLRVLFNMRRHYRIEFEVGADRETRIDGLVEREATGNFVNLGYRASF